MLPRFPTSHQELNLTPVTGEGIGTQWHAFQPIVFNAQGERGNRDSKESYEYNALERVPPRAIASPPS